ncbi:c-type cytochrome [Roseateles sp. BYS78W]|uniref:C-type cytochrome n=1 Tax=Pelomonas candidula TaxID=3299025 RepID=A0ABW7H8L0_9BURK
MNTSSNAAFRRPRYLLLPGALAAALVGGCAVELSNPKPSQQLAREALPAGDVRLGWRVFQQKCAGCHGADATGTAAGPDLLPRVREMGAHRFAGLVLRRYDWILAEAESDPKATAQDPLADKITRGRDVALAMPAWQGNPAVTAHIEDLYAYLSARAEGALPPGRPAR